MEQKSLGNDMSLTLKLQNPLTEEQLDSLLDVDFDHTNEVYFRTKHGKEVTFVKKQEPIEPEPREIEAFVWMYRCGACGHAIDLKDNFCRECGRAVKWDGDI